MSGAFRILYVPHLHQRTTFGRNQRKNSRNKCWRSEWANGLDTRPLVTLVIWLSLSSGCWLMLVIWLLGYPHTCHLVILVIWLLLSSGYPSHLVTLVIWVLLWPCPLVTFVIWLPGYPCYMITLVIWLPSLSSYLVTLVIWLLLSSGYPRHLVTLIIMHIIISCVCVCVALSIMQKCNWTFIYQQSKSRIKH